MKCAINIGQIKTNSVDNNSSINFGPSYHDNHSVDNAIIIGSTFSFGDGCTILTKNKNGKIEKS